MKNWSHKCLLKFHPKKCSIMRIGNSKVENFQYVMDEDLKSIKEEKDLRVIIDNELKITAHLAEKINKANKMVGLIRSFLTLVEVMFRALFVALVRAHLEYGNQVW